LEWLGHYDRFDQQLRTAREYDIMPYIPYTFVAWNPLFASVANKTPEWPKVDYEVRLINNSTRALRNVRAAVNAFS
jgi:chromosome transmission fidelity protein 18